MLHVKCQVGLHVLTAVVIQELQYVNSRSPYHTLSIAEKRSEIKQELTPSSALFAGREGLWVYVKNVTLHNQC